MTALKKHSLIFFCLLTTGITLSSCQRSCNDSCKINVSHNSYILKYERPKCTNSYHPKAQDLMLPLDYTIKCNSCADGTYGSETAVLKATYPYFKKPTNKERSLNKGDISIHLSSNCGGNYNISMKDYPHSQFTKNRRIISKNTTSKGLDANERYAPIEKISDNVYLQKFSNHRKDGIDHYYHQDADGNIVSIFTCSDSFECRSYDPKPIYDGTYSYELRSNGIDPKHLPLLESEVADFLYSLKNYKPEPRKIQIYN